MNFNASITTPSVNVNIPTPVVTPVVPPVVTPVVTPVVHNQVIVKPVGPTSGEVEAQCCVLTYFTLIFCFICRIFFG